MLFDLFYRNLYTSVIASQMWEPNGHPFVHLSIGSQDSTNSDGFFSWDPCCQNIDILKLYSSKIHNKLCNKKLARVEIQLDKLFKTRPKRIEWVATHVFSVALPSPSLRHWFKCWRRWLKRPTAPGLSPRCVSLEPVSCIGMIRLDNIRA